MSDLKALEELVPSTRDGKMLLPAIINSFKQFQESMREMFENFKTDLMQVVQEKNQEICALKSKVCILETKVMKLEERIEENDSYERRDALIISGKNVPPAHHNENTAIVACNILKEHLNYNLQPNEISVSHRLGGSNSSQKPDRRPIILKLCRRDAKMDMVRSMRRLKPEGFFINECLTPTQQTISYILRAAKREFPQIVSGSTTYVGKNFVFVKNHSAGAKDVRLKISSRSKIEEFCENYLGKQITHFIKEWTH